MTKNIFYFLSIVFLLISCSKDSVNIDINNPQEEENNFSLSQTQINSPSSETEFKVNISTNTNWEVLSKPDWVVITPENGNGNIEIKITLLENTTQNYRTGDIKFKSFGNTFILTISQKSIPLSLVSFSGNESPIKMTEPKFLLFNKPITLNSISSGDIRYSFFADSNDVEYFDNNHGVRFTVGHSYLGEQIKYKFSVTDSDNNSLEKDVDFKFYSQKIITPGAIKKMILDKDKNLWVLSLKPYQSSSSPSYIIKYKENEGKYEEELKFEVDIVPNNSNYVGGSFFINPYNDLIYIPDYEGEEVDVYSKTGTLIKQIQIPIVDSDHAQYPHSSPVFIGFNKEGKGIISLSGKGISGQRWRFIDSSNDDLITQPNANHPYFSTGLINFVLNYDYSKLYAFEARSSVIKIYSGEENFDEINLNSIFPNGADASGIIQNKLNDKIYIGGLYNSQIISSDLSYISNQSNMSLLGDFCYDPNLSNHIYGFDEFNFKLLDYDNRETVFDLPLNGLFDWTHQRGIITTSDDKFIITYSDRFDYKGQSQIVIYNTEMFK